MAVAVAVAPPATFEAPPLTQTNTAVSDNTASIGKFDVYRLTVAGDTLTISSVDILKDGRLFEVVGVNAGTSSNFIATEGSELIGGVAANLEMTVDLGSVILRAFGGNLEVRSS